MMVDEVRKAALGLLTAVTEEHRQLSQVMPARFTRLAPAERARAQRLALTTLRQMDRADRMLGPWLRKRPAEPVMNLLRLATVEICAEGAPPQAVVHAAVDLARADRALAHAAGMVNAVLRKVAEDAAKWSGLPVPRLPKWLRKPLIADYGKAVVEAMEAVQAARPPLDLTPRHPAQAGQIAEDLGGAVLPTGSVRLNDPGQVSALRGFAEGAWWVQDAAAALPAKLVAAGPGMRVLDMCAAPGGKTLQLAATGADVTALDISEARMKRVRENLDRTGLSAGMVVADALDFEGGPYDAVLLDAPCSATGTIRRHPDLPRAKTGEDFPELFALQERLIDRALMLTRPGGRVVYCTCSLLIDEGEEQVKDALGRHDGLRVLPPELDGIEPGWIGPESDSGGGLRLRPDYWAESGGMDGFYMAVLQKPG